MSISYHTYQKATTVLTVQEVIGILDMHMAINGDPVPGASTQNKNLISRRKLLQWGAGLAGTAALAPVAVGALEGIADKLEGKKPPGSWEEAKAMLSGETAAEIRKPEAFPTTAEEVENLFQQTSLQPGTMHDLQGPAIVIKGQKNSLQLAFIATGSTPGENIRKPVAQETDVLFVVPQPNEVISIAPDVEAQDGMPVAILDLSPFANSDGKVPKTIVEGLSKAFEAGSLWQKKGIETHAPHATIHAQLIESHAGNAMDKPTAVLDEEHAMNASTQAFTQAEKVRSTLLQSIFTHRIFTA